jgi:cleavage stimulation factor subunit 3
MVNAWKGYLKWEENNPLVIEDAELLSKRIGYALKKCLSEMRHFPEMWCVQLHSDSRGRF